MNKNEVSTFLYKNLGNVRIVKGNGGEPWFCLLDVCNILGLTTTSKVAERLESGGMSTIQVPTYGTNQYGAEYTQMTQFIFINEPNLYRVIFQSRKPEAKEFQDWVFKEVLPMIR